VEIRQLFTPFSSCSTLLFWQYEWRTTGIVGSLFWYWLAQQDVNPWQTSHFLLRPHSTTGLWIPGNAWIITGVFFAVLIKKSARIPEQKKPGAARSGAYPPPEPEKPIFVNNIFHYRFC
jgi:hypothetical protein